MDPVERLVTLPTDAERAWTLVSHPAELGRWLGAEVDLEPVPGAAGLVVDLDGTTRRLVVERVDHGRRLSWSWWTDDDPTAVSHVEISLEPAEGGTAVRVVESGRADVAPQARARAAEAWSHRLLHLESLLLVAASVRG
jgi:uncharacterized protein YndB with AHSA1/START domain